MKRKGIIILAVLVLLAGAGMYFYPDISNMYYQAAAASDIKGYQKGGRELSKTQEEEMLARAEVYNSRLSGALSMDPFRTGGADPSEEDEEYNALLNINGVMAI